MNNQFESAYAMLVRSEEKGRGILEVLVYAVFALSVVLSICQFASA
jgi:ABC-type sugar transport system permease subunit